jgi:hypothetical protein
VAGGARQGEIEQYLFGGGGVGDREVAQVRVAGRDRGGDPGQGRVVATHDAGDGPDLRIGQLPSGERLGDERKVLQGVRHPQVFGGGAQVDPGPPRQPVRARADPVAGPPVAGVELGEELEESALGGGDMSGQPEQFGFQIAGCHGV